MATSFLDILKREDALVKERDSVFDKRVHRMHELDEIDAYPRQCKAKSEHVEDLKKEIETLRNRENEIDVELVSVRKNILRYISTLCTKQLG